MKILRLKRNQGHKAPQLVKEGVEFTWEKSANELIIYCGGCLTKVKDKVPYAFINGLWREI